MTFVPVILTEAERALLIEALGWLRAEYVKVQLDTDIAEVDKLIAKLRGAQ